MLLRAEFATIACMQLLIIVGCFFHVEGTKGFGDAQQKWGYVTVRPDARMFWWLYYTTSKDVTDIYDKPLLIWLQGGPGASSTGYGNFEEIGPLDLYLNERNHTWIKDYNVLFIDNPVGTGFSYVIGNKGFTQNNAQIASDLVECMRGFYKEEPKWSRVPTYVTSESYGGKMAAEFALVWYEAQKTRNISSNLRGVALGDAWISPIDSVLSWATYLLHTGMVNTEGYNEIEKSALETKKAVDNEDWVGATNLWSYTEYSRKESDFQPILPSARNDRDDRLDELMNGPVKQALGLNVTWGAQAGKVFAVLTADFMKPVTDKVERLLNETDLEVFIFTGQLDLIVATPGTVTWVENLKWRNATDWHKAPRRPLAVHGVIEGYVKQFGNFKMYWINRSGHMVPTDNPAAAAAMLEHLTVGKK